MRTARFIGHLWGCQTPPWADTPLDRQPPSPGWHPHWADTPWADPPLPSACWYTPPPWTEWLTNRCKNILLSSTSTKQFYYRYPCLSYSCTKQFYYRYPCLSYSCTKQFYYRFPLLLHTSAKQFHYRFLRLFRITLSWIQ